MLAVVKVKSKDGRLMYRIEISRDEYTVAPIMIIGSTRITGWRFINLLVRRYIQVSSL